MSEDDEYSDQESEDSEGTEETSTSSEDTIPRAKYEKALKEARSLRTRLRRTEIEAKHGKEIVELIPEELPLQKWDEYAEKLATRLKPERTEENEAKAEEKSQEASPSEQKLAAVSTPQEGGAEGATRLSYKEYIEKRSAARTPQEQREVIALRAQGLVDE